MDEPDASLWGTSIAFNTCGTQLCRMLWMLVFPLWVAELCTGRRRTLCYGCGTASAAVDVGLLLYCLIAKAEIVSIVAPWIAAQGLLCIVLLILCIAELRRTKSKLTFLPALALLCAVMSELANARFGFWQRGLLFNSVFSVVMLCYAVRAIKSVPATFSAARRAEEQEKELSQSRISIMLSQIQPHFLYNALNTIQYLCETDPKQASVATAKFSKYLRGNMSSLSQTAPVPIERELEHVESYLYLERLRFPDMKIVYDIGAESFLLPALTLQPLVENAVKHGVRERATDGCITISTWQDERAWYARVSDDGEGFDTVLLNTDGKEHTGIANTRSRLKAICGGELLIESTVGVGTKATIILPKEKKPCE